VRVDDLRSVVAELRAIARAHELPGTVVVQPLVAGHGEAFIGLHARSDLGPVVLFGRGGVLVEVAPKVGGSVLPLAPGEAEQLVAEVAGEASMAALRGQRPWNAGRLVAALEAVAELWRHTGAWLASADLNPVIVTDHGVVVVDALLVAQS
jgi:acetate---CoA ligase (ADP-forming)